MLGVLPHIIKVPPSLRRILCSLHIPTRSYSPVSHALTYSKGQKLHGFIVEEVKEVPELQLTAIRLEHEKTGAKYLHIAKDDQNNLFSVAFCTPPPDSSGVTHILEHLSLCGSENFPCRDPFFKMLNRSLSTFMNAFTGSDYTMYPFSTQNPKDFENLLKVYLDAAFHPCLRHEDFRQEGWRLEYENIEDKSSPIIIKGVVFNEMKGVFADSRTLFQQQLENILLPDNVYAYISGGDPLWIPSLSYEQLKQYHARHYHPTNARFFTYGNFPLEFHLSMIQENTLKKYSKISTLPEIGDITKWSQPKEIQIHCPPDQMAANPEKQTIVSVSYLLNNITDTYESFAMVILCDLLTNGPNASFHEPLIQSGLGSDYSPSTGFNGDVKQSYFSIGLDSIHKDDVEKVKEVIERTFDKVIEEGFSSERVKAVLHRVELMTKHQKVHFGLTVSMNTNLPWNHGANPIKSLLVNDHVKWFRNQMKEDPEFLQKKVRQYFKNNNHKLTLVMNPKDDFEEMKIKEEKNILNKKIESLTEKDKEIIFQEGLSLCEKQKQIEDIQCLPTLQIEDVEKEIPPIKTNCIITDGVSIQLSLQPTNGIVYFRAIADTSGLDDDLKSYMPIFNEVITSMGAGNKDYKQLAQLIDLKTGGLSSNIHISENLSNLPNFKQGILFSSFCLDQNMEPMFKIWQDIFTSCRFQDKDRLIQLIKMTAVELCQNIPHMGHHYTIKQASSCISPAGLMREQMSGLTYITRLKELAEKSDFDETLEKLKKIASIIFSKNNLRCALNATSESLLYACQHMEHMLSSIPNASSQIKDKSKQTEFFPSNKKLHFVLPFPVNYVGKSFPIVSYSDPDWARLRIAAEILRFKYLHREVRERGGAYGVGAVCGKGGTFSFYSYRDPNVTKTLQSFTDAVEWLLQGNISEQDIDEAKLGVFGDVDAPVAPGNRGDLLFLSGITDKMKNNLRREIFETSKEDLLSAVSRHFVSSKCGISLLGPENEELKKSSDWIFTRENVL